MGVKALALVAYPILPQTALHIWKMLNVEEKLENIHWDEAKNLQLTPGVRIEKPEILFEKIEDETIEKEISKLVAYTQ
jgi:methionyl-tRNA synthetase